LTPPPPDGTAGTLGARGDLEPHANLVEEPFTRQTLLAAVSHALQST
jgi:hypothetical protein